MLASGATCAGNFTLPAKNGDGDEDYITITTGGVSLPPAGTRIDPSYRPQLATIKSSKRAVAVNAAHVVVMNSS